MMHVSVVVSTSADAAKVAQWVGEALSNPDVIDTDMAVHVHSIHVKEES